MYNNNTLNRFGKLGLGLSLILGFIVITNTSADAQWRDRNWDNDRDGRYERNSRYDALSVAREHGFRDGMKDGRDASRERDRFNPQNSGDWQKGTNGYEGRYGNKNAYKQAYRDAYVQGYRNGYGDRRNVRNNRSGWRNY